MGIRGFNQSGEEFLNKFLKARGGDSTGLDAVSPFVEGATGMTATGGIISDYTEPSTGNIYRAHIFNSTGTFEVTALGANSPTADAVEYLVIGGGGGGSH